MEIEFIKCFTYERPKWEKKHRKKYIRLKTTYKSEHTKATYENQVLKM